jgi:hypothetical protein
MKGDISIPLISILNFVESCYFMAEFKGAVSNTLASNSYIEFLFKCDIDTYI